MMNWLLVGSVGGGVTVMRVESGGMTYSVAQKLADEINAMYAAQTTLADGRLALVRVYDESEIEEVAPGEYQLKSAAAKA